MPGIAPARHWLGYRYRYSPHALPLTASRSCRLLPLVVGCSWCYAGAWVI